MASNAVINGFRSDITLLLKRFVKQNSTNFKCFCTEWKRMSFHYVFFGYSCFTEMVQFLEDAFVIIKHALLNATCLLGQIGGLYLMYAMYFKQPTKQYCKFRVTLNEWIKINQFYNEICVAHGQVSLVFWKLLEADAFRFVEAEYEYGFERFMQKGVSKVDDESKFKKANLIIESSISGLRNKTMGIIPALEILQVGYNEMKEHLDQTSTNRGLLPTTSIVSDVMDGLGKIDKLFNLNIEDDVSNEEDYSSNSESTDDCVPKKKVIRNRKQSKEPVATSSSARKNLSQKYRGTVTDDGEFIRIQRPSQIKTRKVNPHLNDRQVKTVVKQLELPFEGDSELVLPNASTSTTIKSEKPGKKTWSKSIENY